MSKVNVGIEVDNQEVRMVFDTDVHSAYEIGQKVESLLETVEDVELKVVYL